MSHQTYIKRITAPQIAQRKGGEPIVVLTSYHAQTAALIDPHVDILMVGDSLGMVMHGLETTVPVPLDLMIAHAKAVVRGSAHALVVVDMPFGSYEESPPAAFRSAARIMKETGCGAVKLEGGVQMAETISYLTERGIPVMGHVGMTPQAVNQLGGFAARGRRRTEWARFQQDARAVAAAGAFSLVIEALAEQLAAKITNDVSIPTIGIGASVSCDGQVLVLEDMLGLAPRVPKFVKEYATLRSSVEDAVKAYAQDVRSRAFPAPEHTYPMLEEVVSSTKKPKMSVG
ncbi:MAG: 3-methyl-2-oxobutanoate hydroxymethyltransferase [Pseudomonadota bacterium]